MKFVAYAKTLSDGLTNSNISEIVLDDPILSLNYRGDRVDLEVLMQKEDSSTLLSIEADRLVSQSEFHNYIDKMKAYYEMGVRLFRIKDLGILEYFHMNQSKLFKDLKFILNLESGNHNLASLKFYEQKYASLLDRIIISTEIPFDQLALYAQELTVPIEIFGLGPILLFYTPRKLLAHQLKQEAQEQWEKHRELIVSGTSMESPHSGFEIIQNNSGTLMYAPNHFCLLDYVQKLEEIGISFFRVDLRDFSRECIDQVYQNHLRQHDSELLAAFKVIYPKRILKGLFVVNKSKVLFKKLKNKRLENVQDYQALVVEVVKDSHMVIHQLSNECLKTNDMIFIQSPDGREKQVKLNWIKALDGNNCEQTKKDHHYIIPVVPAISIKSKITLCR